MTRTRLMRLPPWLSALSLVSAGFLLAGCDDTQVPEGRLDGPADLALLAPGTFFEVPVALASNQRNGRVSKLDLKRSEFLVEDSAAPWIPSADLAFGADRILASIVLVQGETTVDVWVVDEGQDQLLRQPYIRGVDEEGKPQWNRPYLSAPPQATGPDGDPLADGQGPELRGLRVAPGRATSESFQITWNGTAFELHGSRSGLHKNLALPGTPYLSDGGELSFTVALSGVVPEIGTSLSFATESGVETLDTGGFVTDLIVSADQQSVYATVLAEGGGGFLVRYDAQNFTEEERVSLGETAVPESLDWGVNDGRLWIADSAPRPDGTGRILGVDTSSGVDWVASIVEVPVPEPAIDVAEGRDPEARRLFVGAAFSDAVWMLDGESLQVLDTNPITPELDPAHVRTLVAGLGASLGLIETNDLDEDGTRLQAYGVLATTFGGELYWLDASSGCQVYGSPAGAAIDTGSDSISSLFVDVGYESDPELVWNASSERFVSTHSCGGVARSELWTVTFDEQLQSYEVEGSRSGLQENRAFEGTRYLSDSGAISFLVLPGVRPTTAGDRWLLPIQDGVTPIPLGEFPGDPLVYTELYDDRSGAWFHVKERQIALVPHLANDVVLWIDIQGQGDGGMRTYR